MTPTHYIENARIFTQILSYDTAFMFACVNADYAKWLVKKHADGEIEILDLLWTNKAWLEIWFFFESNLKLSQNFEPKKASIGKRIVTKQLGAKNYQPMEIIDEYKFKEGTEENKKAWARAQKFVGHGTKVF